MSDLDGSEFYTIMMISIIIVIVIIIIILIIIIISIIVTITIIDFLYLRSLISMLSYWVSFLVYPNLFGLKALLLLLLLLLLCRLGSRAAGNVRR
jgi:hypothetical protein